MFKIFFGGNLSTSKEGDLKMGQMWISPGLTISGLKPQPHVLQKERRVGPAMIQGRLGNCTQLPTPLSHAPFIPPVGGIEVENIKGPGPRPGGRLANKPIALALFPRSLLKNIQGLNNAKEMHKLNKHWSLTPILKGPQEISKDYIQCRTASDGVGQLIR